MKKFGRSCREIWQRMKDEGFNVGKSPSASQKWIHNGSKYYQNIIMNRGKDGYKFSSKYMHFSPIEPHHCLSVLTSSGTFLEGRGMKNMNVNLCKRC